MNGLKTRIRQLLVAGGLALSMTLTAVPISVVPVYAAESDETNGKTSDTIDNAENESGNANGGSQANSSGSTTDDTKQDTADTTQGTDQGAITSGSYTDPPKTIQWVDEENLIMGISPVTGADWYEVVYNNTHSCVYPANAAHYFSSDDGLFHVNVKEDLQHYESTFGETVNSPVLVKVYAGVGSQDAAVDKDEARFASFTVDNYESYLDKMEETPAPTDVTLTLDKDTNKLLVSFKQEKVNQQYPGEYQLFFYLNGNFIDHCFNYSRYTVPNNLIWKESDSGIEIPVSDYVRSENIEKSYKYNAETANSLTVAVKSLAWETDDDGNPRYKVSKMSDSSNSIEYSKATPTEMMVNEDQFQTGTIQELNPYETKKLYPKAPDGASLRLEVKAASSKDNDNKAEEFKNNANINASYTDFSTFEVNLNLVTTGEDGTQKSDPVPETSTTMLITIPIPASLQRKNIAILRNHDGVIEEIGSVVSDDGKTVSFYTDKFSDYAIAVKKDNSGTSDVNTPTNPDTPADPDTPANPVTPVTPGGSGTTPAGPDTGAASKTITDAAASVKSAIEGSSLADSSKKLAGDQIDAISAKAEKEIAAASSQTEVDDIASQAAKDITVVQNLAEKAAKISDVPDKGDLSEAVQYGIISGFINGISDTTFQPAGRVTRAQFAAFLYRLAGSPETNKSAVFSDTGTDLGGSDFAKAIDWMAEQGIAQGFGDGTFRPYETVTREQAVAFLHRYLKDLTDTKANVFDDVVSGAWYEADVNWGVANGIVNGYSDKAFGVGDSTTRGQAVQFIYRALNR